MSPLPLRVKLALSVAVIATGVVGGLLWLRLGLLADQEAVTFWLALCAILVITLLVDQTAQRLVYQRLAQVRQALQRAATDDLEARVAVDGLDEIGIIGRGLNDILEGLERLHDAVDNRVAAASEVFRQRSVAIVDEHREMALLSETLARAGRLAALGQAAANMAHQIGTPLNLISGYVQLLLQSAPPTSPLVERLTAIQDQVTKVTAVVRAALESSRPPVLPREHLNLSDLVRRVCQMAGAMVLQASVEMEVITPDQPADVLADPVQLELALLNLVSNSIDAMPTGGKLLIHLSRSDDRLRLKVEDTGGGIPAELLSRIFEPWVTTKGPGRGTGLGLSIARQVVMSHGGTIRADNRPGQGAALTIDLPAAPVLPPQVESFHAENSGR